MLFLQPIARAAVDFLFGNLQRFESDQIDLASLFLKKTDELGQMLNFQSHREWRMAVFSSLIWCADVASLSPLSHTFTPLFHVIKRMCLDITRIDPLSLSVLFSPSSLPPLSSLFSIDPPPFRSLFAVTLMNAVTLPSIYDEEFLTPLCLSKSLIRFDDPSQWKGDDVALFLLCLSVAAKSQDSLSLLPFLPPSLLSAVRTIS